MIVPITAPTGLRTVSVAPASPVPVRLAPSAVTVAVGAAGAVYAREYWSEHHHPASAPRGRCGWSGLLLSNITLQKSTENALRSRPSPFRADLVTDTGGRLQHFLALQFKRGHWTFHGAYADNRTLGGGSAYSLTNPMAFGVNTVETMGTRRKVVVTKSGLHELVASHRQNGTVVMVGKIDTANWYRANPIFGGDLTAGNDFGNAATRVVAPPFPSLALVVVCSVVPLAQSTPCTRRSVTPGMRPSVGCASSRPSRLRSR